MFAGRFISFEGGEGAGKTTQIRRLAESLDAKGHKVILTREPGGTEGAEAIRKLFVTGDAGRWDAITETLLINAARRDHVERVIRPALARGDYVLCDRFFDSTLAYQGAGKGVDLPLLRQLHAIATGSLIPDVTFLLDLPVEIGLARAGQRTGNETRFEGMDTSFHQMLRRAFLDMAKAEPERFTVLDATGDVDEIARQIFLRLSSH
jgi:dTMP kinase